MPLTLQSGIACSSVCVCVGRPSSTPVAVEAVGGLPQMAVALSRDHTVGGGAPRHQNLTDNTRTDCRCGARHQWIGPSGPSYPRQGDTCYRMKRLIQKEYTVVIKDFRRNVWCWASLNKEPPLFLIKGCQTSSFLILFVYCIVL